MQSELPEGFVYAPEFISAEEEQAVIKQIEKLEFAEIRMHGVVAKRRVVHFGRGYEYDNAALAPAPNIPEFLRSLQKRVGDFAARDPDDCAEVLVTEYPEGAPIGWHRDAPVFGTIVGVSLLSECTMHFRRWPVEKNEAKRSKSLAQVLEPRSVYMLRGPSRTRWQHHIPPTPLFDHLSHAPTRPVVNTRNPRVRLSQKRAPGMCPCLSPLPARHKSARRGPAERPVHASVPRSESRRRAVLSAPAGDRHPCSRC
jgi:alkylated DNA repair protein (DNA oxidative demethylase)